MPNQQGAGKHGHAQEGEVRRVLSLVGDGPRGYPLLELSRRHEAARKGQKTEDRFGDQCASGKAGQFLVVLNVSKKSCL